MSSSDELLADDYARGEVDGVPKCGQGKRTSQTGLLEEE
jgi:hypothetical protein